MNRRASQWHSLSIVNRDPHVEVRVAIVDVLVARGHWDAIVVGIGTLLVSCERELFRMDLVWCPTEELLSDLQLVDCTLVVSHVELWSHRAQVCMA